MKKHFIFTLTLSLTMLVLFAFSPLKAMAEEVDDKKTVIVFGDSIAAGYALEDYDAHDPYKASHSFANLWAEKYRLVPGESYFNYSRMGDPSEDIMKIIKKTEPETLRKADIIIMSIGGDDAIDGFANILLNVLRNDKQLHDELADGIDLNDSDRLEQEIITTLLDPSKKELMEKLIEKTTDDSSGAVYRQIPLSFRDNLTDIIKFIRGYNPEAEIVILAPYNPLESVIFSNPVFSNPLTEALNRCIRDIDREAASLTNDERFNHKLTVISMLDRFGGRYTSLTNLTRLDIHPSPQGHEFIMSLIEQSVFPEKYAQNTEKSTLNEASAVSAEASGASEKRIRTNKKADNPAVPEYVSYILLAAALICVALVAAGFVFRHHNGKKRVGLS